MDVFYETHHNYLLPCSHDAGDILKVIGLRVKVTDNFLGGAILSDGLPSKTFLVLLLYYCNFRLVFV